MNDSLGASVDNIVGNLSINILRLIKVKKTLDDELNRVIERVVFDLTSGIGVMNNRKSDMLLIKDDIRGIRQILENYEKAIDEYVDN